MAGSEGQITPRRPVEPPRSALERFGGNRREAAAALNISTVTLWRKMKQFGLLP
jgi:transcriptional regulator of acetoin/glycerol metabolism